MKSYQINILAVMLLIHLTLVSCKKEEFYPAGEADKTRSFFLGNVTQEGKRTVQSPVFRLWLDTGLDVDWVGTGLYDPYGSNIFRGYLTVRVPGKVRENVYQTKGSIGNPMEENIPLGKYIMAITIDHKGQPSTMITRFEIIAGQKVEVVARFPRNPKTVEEWNGSMLISRLY